MPKNWWNEAEYSLQANEEAKQARMQLEAAKSDNVALVERLKYVQGYQAHGRRKGNCLASPVSFSSFV